MVYLTPAIPRRSLGIRSYYALESSSRPCIRARGAAVLENSTNAVGAESAANGDGLTEIEEPVQEFEDAYTVENLSVNQVQELISTVSEETDIAEVHLKLNDIEVRFRRSAPHVPVAAPIAAIPASPAPLAATESPAVLGSSDLGTVDEPEEKLSLVAVTSKKVGIFRQCRACGRTKKHVCTN